MTTAASTNETPSSLRTSLNVLSSRISATRAARPGRAAQAALPEVERKLAKRQSEVDQLQAGISRDRSSAGSADDAELERELASLSMP